MRLLPFLFVFSLGCGDGGPPGGGGGGGALDYFPLAVGARWEYENADGVGGVGELVKEITRCADVAFVDCASGDDREHATYVQETTGGGVTDDSNILYMEANDDGIVRVKQDFVVAGALDGYVTYSPYFMRLFAPPYGEGREETYTHQRCEFDASGVSVSEGNKTYRHRVIGEEEVTVPAGTYQTFVTERIDVVDGSTKRYYWAEGVGKVREEEIVAGAVGASESLVSFTPGDGSCD